MKWGEYDAWKLATPDDGGDIELPTHARCPECGQIPRGEIYEGDYYRGIAKCGNDIPCTACTKEGAPTMECYCPVCDGERVIKCEGNYEWELKSHPYDQSDEAYELRRERDI